MTHTGFDIDELRHRLADRLDEHPVRDRSAPSLSAVSRLLEAGAGYATP